MRIKKIGNRIVSLLGGREIHPVGAAIGGFFKIFSRNELRQLVDDLEWALEASLETVARLEFPDFEQDYEFVSLRQPDEYPFNEGRLVSNRGRMLMQQSTRIISLSCTSSIQMRCGPY